MRSMLIILGTVAIVMASLGCQSVAPSSVQTQNVYLVHESEQPITIDGRLDEPAWQRADVLSHFFVFSPENARILSPTEVRMLWDPEFFYLAYQCEDKDIWSFSNQRDDSLWDGDVAEFFVKPSRDQMLYYEFVIAPNATVFDARYPSRGAGGANRFKTWESGISVASTVNGTDNDYRDEDLGYIIEVAIPWQAFRDAGKPSIGTEWTFGAFRYDYSKLFEEPLLLKSFSGEALHGFHSYESYGEMRFVGK
ncbi:MAG: carbohydrate-binding family 9-like protein [Candidatus Hydrogenedentes bacterium]|nr:carbohydrate-binding family 9-like protein [Candidatus Hydrogenedentota bacterium]